MQIMPNDLLFFLDFDANVSSTSASIRQHGKGQRSPMQTNEKRVTTMSLGQIMLPVFLFLSLLNYACLFICCFRLLDYNILLSLCFELPLKSKPVSCAGLSFRFFINPTFLIGFSFTARDFIFLSDRRMRGAADLAPSPTGQALTS